MGRSVKSVIFEMLRVIPTNEVTLRNRLTKILEDANYYAPESPTGWIKISDALQNAKAYPVKSNDEWWKFKVCSIVSTQSIEDMKKELFEYEKTQSV